MRNLMGRLNARTDEELQRISIAWLVPGIARDRAALIAQLMRALTDLRATRDFWMRRPHDEREMIAHYVATDADEGFTIDELADQLAVAEAAARTTATRLYQSGALATNARQQQLSVGELPRLFLPRELGQLFARIQDELVAGDVSKFPLPALLSMLDDTDIQRAAELWGLEPMPGLRTRRELTDGLLELTAYPDRRTAVEHKLGWDAKRVLAKVAELPYGQTTSLAELAETLELAPDQPRTAERLRTALDGTGGGPPGLAHVLARWQPGTVSARLAGIRAGTRARPGRTAIAGVIGARTRRTHPPTRACLGSANPVALAWGRYAGGGVAALSHDARAPAPQ